MSSVVNKSQKRFMPSVGRRGPGGLRGPSGRLTGLRSAVSNEKKIEQPQNNNAEESDLHKSLDNKNDFLTPPPSAEGTQVDTQGLTNMEDGDSNVSENITDPSQKEYNENPKTLGEELAPSQLDTTHSSQRFESMFPQRHNNEEENDTHLANLTHIDSLSEISNIPDMSVLSNIDTLNSNSTTSVDIFRDISEISHTGYLQPLTPTSQVPELDTTSAPKTNSSNTSSQTATNTGLDDQEPAKDVAKLLKARVRPNTSQPERPKFRKLSEPQVNEKSHKSSSQPEAPITRPEAPPGCEYIIPEDIPRLKKLERKRRLAFEKELVKEMRKCYAELEKEKLMEDDIPEEQAELQAIEIAEAATFSQLKQSVGSEIRLRRLEQLKEDDEQSESNKQLIDVERFTMGSLCKDIPIGDRNKSYDDYELARINRRRDTVRIFKAKMWSRSKYVPKEEEKEALKEAYRKYQGERQSRSGKIKAEQEAKFSELDESTPESLPQASIEIQADGSISLVGTQYDRHKNNMSNRESGTANKTELDPTEQVINSHSFATKERPDRWSKEETDKFYEALSAWGTDFNLISHLFPLRSRNQIKTKFKYEEKRNSLKIQMHLLSRRKVNIDSYAKVSDVKIEEVTTIQNEIENVRREHADQMKLGEFSKAQAKAEDLQRPIN